MLQIRTEYEYFLIFTLQQKENKEVSYIYI